jgi:hypothetical protein
MRSRLRIRLPLSLLVTAILSALGGGLVAILPSSALISASHTSGVAAKHSKHHRKAPRLKVVVRRGRTGPRGAPGPAGPQGPAGPAGAAGPQIALSLQINWLEAANSSGHESSAATLPGIGTLTATCTPQTQTLTLTPASTSYRTVIDATVFEGEGTQGVSSNERHETTSAPIVLALAPNGMINATVSLEPIAGNGGEQLAAPATLTLSSEFKANGSSGSEDFCYVAGQLIQQQ